MVCGPYAIVQVYAWSSMLVSYSKETGLLQGVKDTFSGEKPCHLCCKVAEAKKADSEKKPSDKPVTSHSQAKAPEFVAASHHFLAAPPATTVPKAIHACPVFPKGIGPHAPPTPPPERRA